MKSSVLIILLSFICYTESYKMLVVYQFPIKSLNNLGQAIVKHLLNDGHEVTFITTHPMNVPQTKNLRQIDISANIVILEGDNTYRTADVLEQKMVIDPEEMQILSRELAKATLNNENVTRLIENSNEHFDAVIVDLFESEVYAGLSVLYNCPMFWVYSMGAHWRVLQLIADPSSPAYDTDYYGTYIPPFTFTQRVQELYSRTLRSVYKSFYTLPIEREIYEITFKPLLAKRGRKLPDYADVIYNASMIFGNEHNAVLSRPSTPQNFKYIGGLHIDDPVKPLPKDLQNLMDNAQYGVIYFSMGSFWKSKDMPKKMINELLQMFGELKQTVIWKFEENSKDLPNNVHIVQWAPQQSILAHPNCKIFISHGGLFSSIETIHFGVPVIGVPLLFDQITNVNKAVASGYAIKVDFSYELAKYLKSAINNMLSDETYRTRVKELSFIYHHRPMKPGAEFIHWVHHVIKTRGALHLRSPAINVSLYQRLYLDLVALVMGIVAIVYWSLKMISSKIKKNSSKKKLH